MRNDGGYIILDLASNNVSVQALNAFNAHKPVMVYDGAQVYYADSIVLDNGNVVITKGGKTITIDSDNNVVSSGDILTIMENIVDSKGNKRFVEGDGTQETIEGLTINYNKWSLSGTHLMCVIAGTIADTTAISTNTRITDFDIPEWVFDKIVPLVGSDVLKQNISLYASNYSTQSVVFTLIKRTTPKTLGITLQNITLTADRNFRAQFDLLIDAE